MINDQMQQGAAPAAEMTMLDTISMESMSEDEREALREALQQMEEEAKAARDSAIAAISQTLMKMRSDAIASRTQSGIESIWSEDAEMYEGIDDANRHEEGVNRTRKPATSDGGASAGGPVAPRKSTVFLNISRPYADAAAARIADMLLPVDDRPWEFKATPIAQIAGMPDPQGVGAPVVESPELTQTEQQRTDIQTVAERRAKNAQRRIDDWLTECDWHGEVRMVIDDSARCGTGVLKGPYPKLTKIARWVREATGGQDEFLIGPASRRISCWDLYPDPSCGADIHNGQYCFERERYWTRKMLGDYRGKEAEAAGWLADQIEACLKEGPKYAVDTNLMNADDTNREDYEVWHAYATLEREDLEAAGCDCGEDDKAIFVPVYAVMCNERVIKITLNPLEDGSFPYDVLPWSLREGMPWGRGVVRQVRTPQRMVNAATRVMMDNAGASSRLLMFMSRNVDTNNGNGWIINGNPAFFVDEGVDLSKAMRLQEVPSRQAELLSIIQFAMKMAEDVTGLPMLMQGQQGGAPDTVGGMQLLNNNANGVLRRMARLFDSKVTEPHIRRYNGWLQQYSDDPEEKGDFAIDARGSSALVERDIQNQAIGQMAPFINDPEFRINKAKWFAEWNKAQRLDPKRFQYTDAEWKQLQDQKAGQPPPKAPQVEVAEIRERGASEREQMKQDAENQRHEAKLAADREVELMKLVGDEALSAKEIKARLLEIVTKDRRERDLFRAQRAVKQQFGESVDMPG